MSAVQIRAVRRPRGLTPETLAAPPGKARQLIADQAMAAIRELSGQEYVHMFASDRKAELAAAPDASSR